MATKRESWQGAFRDVAWGRLLYLHDLMNHLNRSALTPIISFYPKMFPLRLLVHWAQLPWCVIPLARLTTVIHVYMLVIPRSGRIPTWRKLPPQEIQ